MPTNYNSGLIFIIIGIIFSIFSFWKQEFKKIDKKYIIILIPLFISIIIIPFPYSLGPIVLTIGILLYNFKVYILKNEKTNWVFLGISFSGVILTIQIFLFPIYATFISHGQRVDFLSPVVSWFGGVFGLKSYLNNGIIYVQTYEQTYPFTTTWDKLGFYPWFNMLIGVLLIFLFLPSFKKFGKYLFAFLLFSVVYLILRFIFIIFLYTQFINLNIFWDSIFLSISFIPFALLLMRFVSFKDLKFSIDTFKIFKLNKKQIIAILLVFIFIFSLVGAFVYQDPGTEKLGRILIDELHSDWEDSTKKLDKEWYGTLSTYNYYSWTEWLNKYYDVDRNINKTLTSKLLDNYDILILKCPTDSYSDEEIKDIIQFVNIGGGLYLIGDHTNVFGMNYYLNQVSENFGITFKTDATYELGTGLLSVYYPDKIFSHPIVQNIERFEFLTSCTLNAPISSENVIIGNRLLSEPGTYSTENFFRESLGYVDMEYGLLLQVAAVKYGNGRVLAFTDSTCFSNFCIFLDGYTTFNLGALEYLNRINTYSYINNIFLGIAIIAFVLVLVLLRKEKRTMILYLFLTIGLLSFSIATPVFSHLNKINYQLPSPHTDYIKVCFEEEYSDIFIGTLPSLETYNLNNLFGTFFIWTQRIGCVPSLEKTLDAAINKGDIVVIINPIKSFEKKHIDAIKGYLKSGGKVLLMDSVLNTDSTSNKLLDSFNIRINREYSPQSLYRLDNTTLNLTKEKSALVNDSMNNQTAGNITYPYLSIIGGKNVYITENNQTSIAIVESGEGKIVIVADSYTFNDNIMGGSFTEPDESLLNIYNLEFYIFEELLLKNI